MVVFGHADQNQGAVEKKHVSVELLLVGIAYVPDSMVSAAVASGALEVVLGDWPPPFEGYFLYYPSRRQNLLAFQILDEALRHRRE